MNSNAGKKVNDQIKNKREKINKEFLSYKKTIDDEQKKLSNKKNILSKDELETNIEKLKKDMNQFNLDRKKVNFEYNEKRKKAINNFLQKITPLIENYVKKNSISLVLNQKNIFIGSKKYDITNDIIEIVNQNFN